jgi:hypothetical protein
MAKFKEIRDGILASLNKTARDEFIKAIDAIDIPVIITSGHRADGEHSDKTALDLQPANTPREKQANLALAAALMTASPNIDAVVDQNATGAALNVASQGWHVHARVRKSGPRDTRIGKNGAADDGMYVLTRAPENGAWRWQDRVRVEGNIITEGVKESVQEPGTGFDDRVNWLRKAYSGQYDDMILKDPQFTGLDLKSRPMAVAILLEGLVRALPRLSRPPADMRKVAEDEMQNRGLALRGGGIVAVPDDAQVYSVFRGPALMINTADVVALQSFGLFQPLPLGFWIVSHTAAKALTPATMAKFTQTRRVWHLWSNPPEDDTERRARQKAISLIPRGWGTANAMSAQYTTSITDVVTLNNNPFW